MPKLIIINGYRFYFYSNENDELPHIHIRKGDGNGKYWLEPSVHEEYAYGFTVRERRDIRKIVRDNKELFLRKWYENFQ